MVHDTERVEPRDLRKRLTQGVVRVGLALQNDEVHVVVDRQARAAASGIGRGSVGRVARPAAASCRVCAQAVDPRHQLQGTPRRGKSILHP